MDTSTLIVWLLVALMAVLSILLLAGKGSVLVAGYNTSSREEKGRYDVKKLNRVAGGGLTVITAILGVSNYFIFEMPYAIGWMIPWGILGTIAVIAVLANTICLAK